MSTSPTDTTSRSASSPLLDRTDVAQYLNVTPRMAARIMYERRVPVVKVGKHLRVRTADLDAYIDANTRPAAVAA